LECKHGEKKNDDRKRYRETRNFHQRTSKEQLVIRSGEEIWKRRMWKAGLRCGWRKMEAAAEMDEDK